MIKNTQQNYHPAQQEHSVLCHLSREDVLKRKERRIWQELVPYGLVILEKFRVFQNVLEQEYF